MAAKSERRASIDEALLDLEQVADEVRVKLHLAGMDASDTWKETLEPRLFAARNHAREATVASKAAIDEAIAFFRKHAKELKIDGLTGRRSNGGSPLLGELMTKDVATCLATDTAERGAQLMWERACGSVVVVDGENRPISMITDRDICMAAYIQGRPLASIGIASAMSQRLFTVTTLETIATAEGIMRRHSVDRLPVVDGAGRLVGVVSLDDITKHANIGPMLGDALSAQAIAQTVAAVGHAH